MPRAKVVCFINYKGGVGKRTTTYHVGCSLAGHHKKKVLFIDIDPQTNLTFLCAPVEEWQKVKSGAGTIANLYRKFLDKKTLDTKRFIWRSPIKIHGRYRIEGLDLIPCDIDLIGEDLGGASFTGTMPSIEALRKNSAAYLRERSFLRSAIREIETDYDYILIDCPPNLYLMTQNALLASGHYVVTAIPDHLSTIGLSILRQKVERIGKLVDSAKTLAGDAPSGLGIAKLGGIVFVKIRIGGSLVTTTHHNKMEQVREMMGADACFNTHTTELIGYSEAAETSVPVWAHDSENARRASRKGEYQEISEEFLRRFP